MLADIFPGARVLESGVGSGALSMTLLRAGADGHGLRAARGLRRAGRRQRARVPRRRGQLDGYTVEVRNAYDGIELTDLDRIVLDLPEPWQVIKHAEGALRTGGILVAYTPSVAQVMQLRDALDDQCVRLGRDDRGAAPELARRGPGGTSGPSDGRPHWLPDARPPARPAETRRMTRA